jgi:predicted TIM-barrel fold metal-dependent hydrolase
MSQPAAKTPISADSHITEPPGCYLDHIDAKWREQAPRIVSDPQRGDVFVIPGLDQPVPMGLVAAAGVPSEKLRVGGAKFEDWHRGGWDAKVRRADQERDGVGAEIVYPTVGMMLCNHPDAAYKDACFKAYNRWLESYCGDLPDRLFGVGQTALLTPEEGVADLKRMKAQGFVSAMLPGDPPVADFDDPMWDPVWEACVELGMPISFHILTSRADDLRKHRGPKITRFLAIIRGCQDIISTFIFGGVFDRHPGLKLVCVEADAGWAPHFMYRMDHAYKRHRHWMRGRELSRLPSEWFRSNVWLTFQDDWTAFQSRGMLNPDRLLWANDFPHSDSTWPRSMEVLAEQTADLTMAERNRIVHDNVAELYGLNVA